MLLLLGLFRKKAAKAKKGGTVTKPEPPEGSAAAETSDVPATPLLPKFSDHRPKRILGAEPDAMVATLMIMFPEHPMHRVGLWALLMQSQKANKWVWVSRAQWKIDINAILATAGNRSMAAESVIYVLENDGWVTLRQDKTKIVKHGYMPSCELLALLLNPTGNADFDVVEEPSPTAEEAVTTDLFPDAQPVPAEEVIVLEDTTLPVEGDKGTIAFAN